MKAKGTPPVYKYKMTKNNAIDTVEHFITHDAHPDPSRLGDNVYIMSWENAMKSIRYLVNWVADHDETEDE